MKNQNFQNPEKTIFYQIEKAIKQYRTMAQNNLNELGYSITINQVLMLIQIEDRPEISQVELSEFLFKDVASITRMTELLVKRGFLLRAENKDDRRKKDLKITDKGRVILKLAIPIIKKNRETALASIDPEEKEKLFKTLSKIILNTSK
ncbi:MAG: MarR family transcriptional regulator [Maribacter sp.]|nr:MAG: MarR family transcriptional regulator [Maribacter sp.]